MVKFLVGLLVGTAFCAAVLGAMAVLNPLGQTSGGNTPAPAGQLAQDTPQPQPAAEDRPVVSASNSTTAGEPPAVATAAPGETDTVASGADRAPAPAGPDADAAASATPPAATEPRPEPAASAGAESDALPSSAETLQPASAEPQPQVAQSGDETAAEAAARTAAGNANGAEAATGTGEEPAAPMVGMIGGGAPGMGGSGPDVFAGPQVGGGAELSAPAIGAADSANVARSGSDRPIRMAGAPQQVSAGSVDTGGRPSVNTESTGTPEIGGSELEEEDLPPGPPPPLQAGSALADNAARFAGNTGRPLMSIILIDTGEHPDLRPGLTALTAPITFGVEAGIRDAGGVAREYRGAGFEVTAVIPGGGRLGLVKDLPEDKVEPLLAYVIDRVPVAATVMDPIDGPLPKDRRLANAMLDALTVTGHGLLTHRGNGLNNVPIIAAEQGVPSALVYRVIDDEPGSANINLALERAVLDASRSGHVIVVGRVRQETVTTLFSWLLGSGAREVTIAPVSAVLRAGQS